MKQAILLILAMMFSFAMPAQASEGYAGFSPVASYSLQGDSVAKITDDKVTSARQTVQQMEASVYFLNSKASYAEVKSAAQIIAMTPLKQGAEIEVGWRRS